MLLKPDKLHPRVVLERAHCDRTAPEPTGHVRQQVVLRKRNCFEGFRRFSLSQKRVEALGKEVYRTFKARPRLGLQEPTSRELTVFVTRTLAILSGFLLIGDSLAAIFWKVNFS